MNKAFLVFLAVALVFAAIQMDMVEGAVPGFKIERKEANAALKRVHEDKRSSDEGSGSSSAENSSSG